MGLPHPRQRVSSVVRRLLVPFHSYVKDKACVSPMPCRTKSREPPGPRAQAGRAIASGACTAAAACDFCWAIASPRFRNVAYDCKLAPTLWMAIVSLQCSAIFSLTRKSPFLTLCLKKNTNTIKWSFI